MGVQKPGLRRSSGDTEPRRSADASCSRRNWHPASRRRVCSAVRTTSSEGGIMHKPSVTGDRAWLFQGQAPQPRGSGGPPGEGGICCRKIRETDCLAEGPPPRLCMPFGL